MAVCGALGNHRQYAHAWAYGDWYVMFVFVGKAKLIGVDMMEVVDPKFVEAMRQSATAEKRLGTTDDIAQIAAFIAEDGSRWINGDTFSATGGGWMP